MSRKKLLAALIASVEISMITSVNLNAMKKVKNLCRIHRKYAFGMTNDLVTTL